jgi:predicted Rossmann fold flavoprotein
MKFPLFFIKRGLGGVELAYDVIIIGAGAAGLMTAIQAAEGGLNVLLLEGQKKVGAKILMSGGTRCNVTNKAISEKDFNSEKIIYVRNILRSFTNTDAIEFFSDLGVELVLEPTGKYFPVTNSGKTVLDALLAKVSALNIMLLVEHKVQALTFENNEFNVKGENFHFKAKRVVLTTGGLSYPTTGSDGTGYRLAQSFGHPMIETVPALTPLSTNDKNLKSLSGITLDVELILIVDGKKSFSVRDSFLFTHFGFSGPTALDISRHYIKSKGKKEIIANFIPDHDETSWGTYLRKVQQDTPRKTIRGLLIEFLPQRLVDLILKQTGIDSSLIMNQLDKVSRQRLIDGCVRYPLDVMGVLGYGKAEVTAGGIDFSEINPKILESKLMPGLFFAGEILDVDGRIGGFNFQWAWASGYTVAQALLKHREPFNEQENHQNG